MVLPLLVAAALTHGSFGFNARIRQHQGFKGRGDMLRPSPPFHTPAHDLLTQTSTPTLFFASDKSNGDSVSNLNNISTADATIIPARNVSSTRTAPSRTSDNLKNVSTADAMITPTKNATSTRTAPSRITDNVTRFEQDIVVVIKEVRAGQDKTVPELFRHGTKLTISNVWTGSDWDRHMSRWRYVRYMIGMHKSRLLRRIGPQLLITMLWSTVVFTGMAARQVPGISGVNISLTSLSLVSTFIAALLTLRSNKGLSRLSDARNAWGTVVAISRDTAQLLASYISPYEMELGLLSARHLSMFGWLLKCHLREESSGDIVTAMLPNPTDAGYVLSQRKRAAALILRIRQIVGFMAGKNRLPYPAHQAVENNLLELNRIHGMCERIKGSCIPPLYTAHVSRLLVFYLFFLPFALQGAGINKFAGILVTFSVGFSMLGLDEISMQLEQPFRLMPLHQQSINAMRDVADAFVCPPPKLKDRTISDSTGISKKDAKKRIEYPQYW